MRIHTIFCCYLVMSVKMAGACSVIVDLLGMA
jgi:hypothetical protein